MINVNRKQKQEKSNKRRFVLGISSWKSSQIHRKTHLPKMIKKVGKKKRKSTKH